MIYPLVSAGYVGRSTDMDAQLCVNLMPEIQVIDGKTTVMALVGTPGLTLFANVGAGSPVRGMHVMNNSSGASTLYVVVGSGLYSINTAGTISASLGTLATSSGNVYMADNGNSPTGGNQLMIVDGSNNGYIFNVSTLAFTNISGGGWPSAGAVYVTYMDGYFIISVAGQSGQFQVSNLYDGTTWQAINAAGDSYISSALLAIRRNHSELWLYGSGATAFWYDSGQGNPPFQRISGGILDHGIAAPLSLADADNTVFWLAQNSGGGPYVVEANGHLAAKVSTAPLEYQWKQYSTVADAFAFTYTDEGHQFYWLTFPSGNATFVYDLSTQLWHQRSSYSGSGSVYSFNRHWASGHVFWNNGHYVGDYRNGNIYKMSSTAYTDNGTAIIGVRTLKTINEERKNMVFSRVQVDCETGTGDYSTSPNPQMTLDWSNDGGHTYGTQHSLPMGTSGQYAQRMVWRRCGYGKERTFRITMSDAVKRTLTAGYVEAIPGKY